MGELHLEILIDRLKREYKVECNYGKPQVTYKEAIVNTIRHREIFKKQTGGRGRFADIEIIISPADNDKQGLQFINNITQGAIPKEYIPTIKKAFEMSLSNGPIAGNKIHNIKIELIDGAYHSVDSDALAFEIAAKLAFKEATKKAQAILLEPIMKLEIQTPEEYMGDVISDINKRRGNIHNSDIKDRIRVIKATVPLAETFGYVTDIRSLTSGRANSNLEFFEYRKVPNDIAQKIIDTITGRIYFQ